MAHPPVRPLTPKQQRFVDEYLIDLNATQAAIRAGYNSTNADVTGPRLLGNVRVASAVAARLAKAADRADLTVHGHLTMLETLRDEARQAGQLSAAILAEQKRGEVGGFYIRRREDVTKLSPAERADRIKRVLKLA